MNTVLVCESVRAASIAELVRARDAVRNADLVEVRLDSVADPDAAAALAGRSQPVIVTCRPVWEGGTFAGSEEERQRLLEQALRSGAEFVDVEARAPWAPAFLERWRTRVVLSWHDFETTPSDLADRARHMVSLNPAVVKVAVTPRSLRDLAPLGELHRLVGRGPQLVVIGMGAAGVATRVLPQRFGSCWTYGGDGVAPGQVATERLVREFRVRAQTRSTVVLAAAGSAATTSPELVAHNAGFAALGINGVCIPLQTSSFEDFGAAAELLEIGGSNVGAPLGLEACRVAEKADRLAVRAGAADTLQRAADGAWVARNADVDGFLAPLADFPIAGKRTLVLGTGSAARAALAGLTAHGAQVAVWGRRPGAAETLAAEFGAMATPGLPQPGRADVVVNATPVDLWPEFEMDGTVAGARSLSLVYDLSAGADRSASLRRFAEAGVRTIDGFAMLLKRTLTQFEWWTGQRPPTEAIESALCRQLERPFRPTEIAR